MVVTKTITDNDHVPSKVALRLTAVEQLGEPRPILVLDAYHGHGRLWKLVEEQLPPGWTINMYRADREGRRAGTLKIDNAKLLASIDLTRFDLIDLDAYGWPTAQLRIVARKAPDTPVITTRNSRALGQIPHIILDDLNIKVPPDYAATLIGNVLGDELWEAWLHHLGYRHSLLYQFEDNQSHIVKRYELLTRGDPDAVSHRLLHS